MTKRKHSRETCDYNLRERVNIYAGAAIGTLAPVAAVYGILSTVIPTENFTDFAIKAGVSLAVNLVPIPKPIAFYGFSIGSVIGAFSAAHLQRRRVRRERSEKSKLEEIE